MALGKNCDQDLLDCVILTNDNLVQFIPDVCDCGGDVFGHVLSSVVSELVTELQTLCFVLCFSLKCKVDLSDMLQLVE